MRRRSEDTGGNTKEGEEEEIVVAAAEEGKEEEEERSRGEKEREEVGLRWLLQSTSVVHSPIWSNLRFPSAQIENIRPRLRARALSLAFLGPRRVGRCRGCRLRRCRRRRRR